ncbi:MAG: beta-galactosidase [Planctomycetota bacterium]|nr:beta-galactosidase [Planctomycetota bacterium]
MASVTYDDCNFLVDGKRIWLVSGAVHSFRIPSPLWADRLLKAKRAGLNCISTPVVWNLHEPHEGKWDAQAAADLLAFIKLAGEMGLYVILQPGPYVGADWDSGGLPGWLTAKSGMSLRSANAAFTHYFDKYFAQILPRLAECQVTRGGNIILIQNENEYVATMSPDRLTYLEFINQLFRRSGFDIPIITANQLSDPPVPDAIDTVHAGADLVGQLKRMRLRQPSLPLIASEVRVGGADAWGGQHIRLDARASARRALEALGCGAQFNYALWQGGTNFGFHAGKLTGGSEAYQTTSYDCDAPVAESGGLTDKYYHTRLVNMLANHMGEFFAAALMDDPGVSILDATAVLNVSGLAGRWAVVTNNGRDDIQAVRVSLPEAQELNVSLHPLGAAAVPVNVSLAAEITLDYANCMPLGFFGSRVLVLHGPAGWDARVSVNGKELSAPIPDGEEPLVLEADGLTLVLMTSELAMRTWWVADTLVFGPTFVGETLEQMTHPHGASQYCLLAPGGKLTRKKIASAASAKHPLPKLSAWKRLGVCTEPVSDDLEWTKIDRARDFDRLGVDQGYAWYRIELHRASAGHHALFLPDCEDRATLYLNGRRLGIWGRGEEAHRLPIPVNLRKGANVMTALVENLGRPEGGARLGELKGISGPVYDAKLLKIPAFKIASCESLPKRIVPRAYTHMMAALAKMPAWTADAVLAMPKVRPLHVSFRDLPYDVAILCNDRLAGFFPRQGETSFGDLTLGSELRSGKNAFRLLLWGPNKPKALPTLAVHELTESLTDSAAWSYRPWDIPKPGGPVVGKDQPAWYVSEFRHAPGSDPLFLHVIGAKKGQIVLNGHNLGRFWTIGPQQEYYLPECWLAPVNELLIFEEQGRIPANSQLVYKPLGPYR